MCQPDKNLLFIESCYSFIDSRACFIQDQVSIPVVHFYLYASDIFNTFKSVSELRQGQFSKSGILGVYKDFPRSSFGTGIKGSVSIPVRVKKKGFLVQLVLQKSQSSPLSERGQNTWVSFFSRDHEPPLMKMFAFLNKLKYFIYIAVLEEISEAPNN